MLEPLPAHKRAEILVRVAGYLGRRHEEVAQTISAEAGKPLKAARVEVARAMSTYTMSAVQARTLAGEMVPMDASQAGVGKLALHPAAPDRRRRCDLALQLPAQPRRAQARAGARRGLRGRPEAGLADAALGAPARRARDGGRAPAGLAERARRTGFGARRRARRGRAGARDHLHGLGCGRLEARGAGAAQARQPRARQRDAGHRGGGCRPRGRRDQAGRKRLLVRRPELHLGAADLRAAGGLRRAARTVPAQGRGAQGRRSGRRGDGCWPADRP